MKLNIAEMLRTMVEAELSRAIASTLGADASEPVSTRTVKATDVVAAEPITRTRRANGSHVSFAIQWNGKTPLDIIATAQETLMAAVKLAKAHKPVNYASLIKATGRSENSIQSAVWWLRNHDASGVRQDKELVRTGKARKALLRTVQE